MANIWGILAAVIFGAVAYGSNTYGIYSGFKEQDVLAIVLTILTTIITLSANIGAFMRSESAKLWWPLMTVGIIVMMISLINGTYYADTEERPRRVMPAVALLGATLSSLAIGFLRAD